MTKMKTETDHHLPLRTGAEELLKPLLDTVKRGLTVMRTTARLAVQATGVAVPAPKQCRSIAKLALRCAGIPCHLSANDIMEILLPANLPVS